MKIAIVGSRNWKRLHFVDAFVDYLKPGTTVISGGAPGVDRIAARSAEAKGLEVKIFKAEWDRLGKGAGFIRNQLIIDACDCVVAFWDGESKGTRDTLRKATDACKPSFIFYEPWLTHEDQLIKGIQKLEKRVASGKA